MSEIKKYDIAVIGSGPGGFAAAVRATQLGAKVAVIEKAEIGGTCLNCGCMPTKFLWQALKTKQKIQKSYEYGFKAALEPFNFADIIAKKDRTIANLRKGMEMILSSYSIDVINGKASFKDKNTVSINKENEIFEINADKIIIATGTTSSEIKGFEFGGKIISSTEALNLQEVPKNMLIVGGGAIGVEMATIFAGFGSKVTIAEMQSQLIPTEDEELSAEIKKNLQRQSVEVLLEYSNVLEKIADFEKILIVTGRIANNELDLCNAGIKTNEKGFIITDDFCKTNVENIYAIGDIAGKSLLAYTAQNEGAIAAENAMDDNKIKINNEVIPQVVFSMPQSASVKVNNFEKINKQDLVFGKFPFTASGRAFLEQERAGFVKCAINKQTNKAVAFWIIGNHADELINTAAMILNSDMNDIKRQSLFHPSLSESLFCAYEDAFGKCTELGKKK